MFDAYTLNATNQYATIDEIDYLVKVGAEIITPTIMMLGAGPGVLALAALHSYAKTGNSFPFIGIVDNDTFDYAFEHLSAIGVKIPPGGTGYFWKMDSADLAHGWEHSLYKGKIGLLIVDADHSTKAVLRDIDAWFPHVASRGLIFFHDYLEREGGFKGEGEWEKGTVARALSQRSYLKWETETEVGISAVYRKL